MIAFLSLLVATPALAARLHGNVRLPGAVHDDPTFNAYVGQASSMAAHMHAERGVLTDAVLYVEALPASVDTGLPLAATHPRLAQKDQSFQPRVVVIPVGGTVDFPNLDAIYHNVFSVSPVKRFDLGKYPRGESRSVRFLKPGLVNVFCDIHSDMAGFILVTPNRAFTRAKADGTWQLPDLPPGHYVLRWWHPDFPGGKREVELGGGESNVDVEF